MTDNTTRSTKQILEGIEEALFDICESLAIIAASTDKPAGVVESFNLGSFGSSDIGSFHSDGGVNFATGTSTNIRTYGDPTILSGNEEGLK